MKKQKEKRKVCGRVYRRRTIAGIVILALFTAGLNKVVSAYSSTISSYLGNGEATVTSKYDTEGWNAEYYEEKYADSADSQAAAAATSETIADEGIVLLKNTDNTLPLEKGSSVTPFGYRYTNPVYGGTGSGNVDTSMDYVWTAEEALSEYFDLNEKMSDALNNAAFRVMDSESVTESKRESSGNGYSGASTDLVEFDSSVYTDELLSAAEESTAVVFIGREGGEGADLQYTSYADGTAHELRLTSYEKETLRIARETCNKLVVIINSSNAMELSEIMEGGEYEADAVLWIGGPGAMGFKSMAKIMCGETNPSGKTVDIFVADLTKDPTYVNTGNDKYDNKGMTYSTLIMGGFIEEEEGIYYGYRYYETAYDIGAADFDYEKAVVAPFGYGLSYTQFSQEITDFTEDAYTVTISVTSTNMGTVSGKDVVEIYTTAPYTDLDIEYKTM